MTLGTQYRVSNYFWRNKNATKEQPYKPNERFDKYDRFCRKALWGGVTGTVVGFFTGKSRRLTVADVTGLTEKEVDRFLTQNIHDWATDTAWTGVEYLARNYEYSPDVVLAVFEKASAEAIKQAFQHTQERSRDVYRQFKRSCFTACEEIERKAPELFVAPAEQVVEPGHVKAAAR